MFSGDKAWLAFLVKSKLLGTSNLKVGKACPDFCFCCFWTCRAILLVRLVLAFSAGVFLATSAHVLFLTDFLIERAGVLAGFFGVAFLAGVREVSTFIFLATTSEPPIELALRLIPFLTTLGVAFLALLGVLAGVLGFAGVAFLGVALTGVAFWGVTFAGEAFLGVALAGDAFFGVGEVTTIVGVFPGDDFAGVFLGVGLAGLFLGVALTGVFLTLLGVALATGAFLSLLGVVLVGVAFAGVFLGVALAGVFLGVALTGDFLGVGLAGDFEGVALAGVFLGEAALGTGDFSGKP